MGPIISKRGNRRSMYFNYSTQFSRMIAHDITKNMKVQTKINLLKIVCKTW